jgi:hypothetical protein
MRPGEWFYDQATTTLYIYPPLDADAKKPLVEVVIDTAGFGCGGATVDGIGFARIAGKRREDREAGDDHATAASRTSATTRSAAPGTAAVRAFPAAPSPISATSASTGSRIRAGRAARSSRTIISSASAWCSATVAAAHGAASGMIVNKGKAVTVKGNRMIDIGNNGIILGAPGVIVERNVFVRCMGSL